MSRGLGDVYKRQVITAVIMHNDRIRVVFDPSKRAPWLRQVRGKVTIDYVQQTK